MIGKTIVTIAAFIALALALTALGFALVMMPVLAWKGRDPLLGTLSALVWLAIVGLALAAAGI